jgi:type II secretory ATPase GspE/PulE/Tfp pilus assembly ATPase PilB-like protein|tara:strand:- start:630 stop:932 length:303 start_codon:yes stop_codon:yes gene_type:complete
VIAAVVVGKIPLSEDFLQFMTGSGCDYCSGTGFMGRRRVFEVLAVDENIEMQIAQDVSIDDIRDTAARNGMISMGRAVMEMARNGKTTLSEVSRSWVPLD